jgi:CRP/FNR family transcriptional regulator, cyclic AMP receptor protein
MITPDHLRRIAIWSRDLSGRELEAACSGVTERSYRNGESIFVRGDQFDYWTGVVSGLVRMGTVSRSGKAMTFTGLSAGAWFGEGTVLKKEPRRYDMVALRDSRIALMDQATFVWLYENSVAFNRFLVVQLNERLGQFIGWSNMAARSMRPRDWRAPSPRCSIRSSIPISAGIWRSPRRKSERYQACRGRMPTSA